MSKQVASEEELIRRFLAPLAADYPGALGLLDDCALLQPSLGAELVLTTDAIAAGVHFLPDDVPDDIAWKALAVNASDLAGKGAEPLVYVMALSFPEAPEEDWLVRFTAGLSAAQERFGLKLAGGDTDRRPGPLTVTIAAIGSVPSGGMVRRTTAKAGDRIFVSGTLGDAALGLKLRRSDVLANSWALSANERQHLLRRYVRPEPRLALRHALRSCASAAMDISDGLVKDLSRMCRASGCGARIETGLLPLSPAARKAVATSSALMADVMAGGDDYEIIAAVPPDHAEDYRRLAEASGIEASDIGIFEAAAGLRIRDENGQVLAAGSMGWDHFERAPADDATVRRNP